MTREYVRRIVSRALFLIGAAASLATSEVEHPYATVDFESPRLALHDAAPDAVFNVGVRLRLQGLDPDEIRASTLDLDVYLHESGSALEQEIIATMVLEPGDDERHGVYAKGSIAPSTVTPSINLVTSYEMECDDDFCTWSTRVELRKLKSGPASIHWFAGATTVLEYDSKGPLGSDQIEIRVDRVE